jgi:hypothetical protein
MRRRRLTEAQQHDLVQRQAALTSLTKHPAWPDLEAEVAAKRERVERVVLAKTIGTRDEVDLRDIYYLRGFLGGMAYMLAVCENAEATLESFLKEAM